MDFEYPEDRAYFESLLCEDGESLEDYADLFDFRDPSEKRKEASKIRDWQVDILIKYFGRHCMIEYAPNCDDKSGFELDHVIPLSSNKLNKEIRLIPTSVDSNGKRKKTPAQSFGSNSPRNLVLACKNCNANKKHRFLPPEKQREILKKLSEFF